MTKLMHRWVRLPSNWINQGGLKELRWGREGSGSDNIAALMALIAILHHADQQDGIAKLTYEDLYEATGLSRAKISSGLDVLEERLKVVQRMPLGRSTFKLLDFGPGIPWAKFPARGMYCGRRIEGFKDFSLRKISELNALKLLLLIAARRGENTNAANISYEKIEAYAGIERPKIKTAISTLVAIPLIYVEQIPTDLHETGVANAYRIIGIDSYKHMGTIGRRDQFNAEDMVIPF
jgi:hypothetical protein